MTTFVSATLLLSLVIIVHGNQKRAASCEVDYSIPCECTNPFLGTDNFFLGDPKQNCKAAKACYVKNLSGCSDARQSRGGGRCQSKQACAPEPTVIPATQAPVVKLPKCPEETSKFFTFLAFNHFLFLSWWLQDL